MLVGKGNTLLIFIVGLDNCDILLNENSITDIRLSVGDNVTFQCICNDGAAVEWKLDGGYASNDFHRIINNGTLTILAVRISDNGNYSCGDSHFNLTVNGNSSNLYYLPNNLFCITLDTFVKSVVIPHPLLCINNPAILECHVTLNTAIGSDLSVLNISWYHNGTYLSTNNVTRDDDQYLYISRLYLISVNDTNSGEYTCEANIVEDEKLVIKSTNVQGQYLIASYSNCVSC